MAQILSYRKTIGYRRPAPAVPAPTLPRDTRVFVAYPDSVVGRALRCLLAAEGFTQVVAPQPTELDVTDAAALQRFFRTHQPEVVVLPSGYLGWSEGAGESDPPTLLSRTLTALVNVAQAARSVGVCGGSSSSPTAGRPG